jgi:hypothetical protein
MLLRLAIAALATAAAMPALAADSFEDARAAPITAYDAKDYNTLCKLLDQYVVFRGSVKPDLWTSGRDNVITTRWGSAKSCNALNIEPSPTAEVVPGIVSVPTHTLLLTPDVPAGSLSATANNQAIAVDTGQMFMGPRAGETNVAPHRAHYIMIWRDTGAGWKLIHLDMHASE